MANTFFSFEPFNYGAGPNANIYDKSGVIQEAEPVLEPEQFFSPDENCEDFVNLLSQHDFLQESIDVTQKRVFVSSDQDLQQQNDHYPFSVSDFETVDDVFPFNFPSPPFQQSPENSVNLDSFLIELSDIFQPKITENPHDSTTFASLEPLDGYKSCEYNQMNGVDLDEQETHPVLKPSRLSTEEVMRVAGAQYIQFSARNDDYNHSMISHPFDCAYYGLTDEETSDIELAHLLLAAAEKIGNQELDRGSKLLSQCAYLSSDMGNPVQRIAHYFSKALWERIDRETGTIPSKGAKGGGRHTSDADGMEAIQSPNPLLLESHQKLPFSQMILFPGVQAILESLGLARKVHLIDLGLKCGVIWTVLMQALAARQECRLLSLKLTVIGKNQRQLQATGKRLTSFAATMGLPFSFEVVMVANIEDITKESFNLKADEAIALYSGFVLKTMITCADRFDSLMRVIRSLNPCILLVAEVEGNHNSPSFFNRFTESLFFFSATFDCVEACIDRTSQTRMALESFYFGHPIMNIVAKEGEERTRRHVGIDVWRAFFARFGMVEKEFSHSSLYQANLIRNRFACGSSCTLKMNDNSLIIGWKGTPIFSLSAWKFY